MHIIMGFQDIFNSHGIVNHGNLWAQPPSDVWDPFCTALC